MSYRKQIEEWVNEFNYFDADKLMRTLPQDEKYGLHMLIKYGPQKIARNIHDKLIARGLADKKGATEKGKQAYHFTTPKRTNAMGGW